MLHRQQLRLSQVYPLFVLFIGSLKFLAFLNASQQKSKAVNAASPTAQVQSGIALFCFNYVSLKILDAAHDGRLDDSFEDIGLDALFSTDEPESDSMAVKQVVSNLLDKLDGANKESASMPLGEVVETLGGAGKTQTSPIPDEGGSSMSTAAST